MTLADLVETSRFDFDEIITQVHDATKLRNEVAIARLKVIQKECRRYLRAASKCRDIVCGTSPVSTLKSARKDNIETEMTSESDIAACLVNMRLDSARHVVDLIDRVIQERENALIEFVYKN